MTDTLDHLLADARDAMGAGQTAVADVLRVALDDHERFGAAIRARPKPWFFAADETLTVFCTEGRPGNASAPHDHGTWSILGCFDGSEESWWHETDGATGLRHVGSGVLRAGEVHTLSAEAIHSVMNRWNIPNGVVHLYAGNFLAAERHIWDPVTHERHQAGLSEPLAPARGTGANTGADDARLALAGTAFAAISVTHLPTTAAWMADVFGLIALTDQSDSCSVDESFSYLVDPTSLTIVGLHATRQEQARAGLDHLALRVPTLPQLEQWHDNLATRGLNPSAITAWNFGTFVDVTGPDALTVRLFVPAVR